MHLSDDAAIVITQSLGELTNDLLSDSFILTMNTDLLSQIVGFGSDSSQGVGVVGREGGESFGVLLRVIPQGSGG